jgi:hypothetical protein
VAAGRRYPTLSAKCGTCQPVSQALHCTHEWLPFQGEPEHGGIGLAVEFALRRTAVADLQRIVPDTVVNDGFMVVLLSTDTQTASQTPTANLGPWDLYAGICLPDATVLGIRQLTWAFRWALKDLNL